MLLMVSMFFGGAAFVLVIQIFIIYHYFRVQPYVEPKLTPVQKPVINPELIAKYCGIDGATHSESCMFLNLIFQFLWKEWRDSPKTRNFFIKKMNLEFKEMLLNKAAGKLMQQITVRDYYLGDSLPIIKEATVMKLDTRNPSQVPREIDVALDIEYSGGFVISLDIDLIFGKSAHFTIKMNSLVGRIRLQFTRNPCTHWSFSFYEDPKMEIEVESDLEGKNQPKLTSFIQNQIRRSIKKKHTFPRYKVRYKPFFVQDKPQDGKNEVFLHNNLITVGKLDVEIVECTRIPTLPKGSHIYCTLSLDCLPWKEDMPMRRALWPVHEVLIRRAPSGSIGVSFCQTFENVEDDKRERILVKTVTPNSPAAQVDIEHGDILISVNNVDIVSIRQTVRLIKNAGNKLTFKLQRPPVNDIDAPGRPPNTETEEIVEKPKCEEITPKEIEESFDFNSILLHDEDSETEEFVNIVVHEIQKEMADEDTRKLINEIRRASNIDLLRHVSNIEPPAELKQSPSTESSSELQNSVENVDSLPLNGSATELGRTTNSGSIKRRTSNPEQPFVSNRRVKFNNQASTVRESLVQSLNLDSSKEITTEQKIENNIDKNKKIHRGGSFPFSFGKRKSVKHSRSDSTHSLPVFNSESIESLDKKNEQSPVLRNRKNKHVTLLEEEVFTYDDSLHNSYEPLGVNLKQDDLSIYSADGDTWDNISHHNIEVVSDKPIEEEKEPTGQKTSIVNASQEAVWNEIFSFDVEKGHKILNICVWGKCEDTLEEDMLLGYVSIPLMELALECLSTSSCKSIQTFFLSAAASRSAISRTYLRVMMPGINLSCCNGDITLAYKYTSAVPECDLAAEEMQLLAEQLKKKELTKDIKSEDKDKMKTLPQEHNFVGTEFYFPTRCDYCQNKVWRKVAFQCRVCAMVSHKRCIQNAQANTYCTSDGVRAKPPAWQVNDNVHVTNEETHESDGPKSESLPNSPIRSYSLQVPDENDLRPGIKNGSHSPQLLRRKHLKTVSLDELIKREDSFGVIPDSVNDSIAAATVTAKEAGRELFASLDESDREFAIQNKVEQLQDELSVESEKQVFIRKQFLTVKDSEQKHKLQTMLRKSEERGQALALLMIQYCSALNECLSVDEPQQCDL